MSRCGSSFEFWYLPHVRCSLLLSVESGWRAGKWFGMSFWMENIKPPSIIWLLIYFYFFWVMFNDQMVSYVWGLHLVFIWVWVMWVGFMLTNVLRPTVFFIVVCNIHACHYDSIQISVNRFSPVVFRIANVLRPLTPITARNSLGMHAQIDFNVGQATSSNYF